MNPVIRKTNPQEEKRKAVCLEQLTQDRQQLLLKWPFIGGIIMRMEFIPVRDDRLTTASTDGDHIFVDINFYGSLTKPERLFVLAHEVWHCVLMHFARKQGRDTERFNIAADLEIHFALVGEKMQEPWVLPHKESWAGLSAEEIYEQISESYPSDLPYLPNEKKTSAFDKHLYEGERQQTPEEATEMSGETETFVVDDEYTPLITRDAPERIRGRIIASAQQVERTQGKLPGSAAALLEKILKPELPWQEMLKQFVTTCYGGKRRWLPPARRHVWHDLYLPSMRDERLHAIVALDTSGSTENDLQKFFAELVSLMKSFGNFELDVVQCDACVQSVEHFSEQKIPEEDHKWQINGMGGTDFRPVFDWVKKQKKAPELLIYFTDGVGTAPAKAPVYPVLWVLTKDGKIPCKWGRSVRFH